MLPRSPRGTGFTLIELLVALLLITILMAILLPALRSARNTGVQAQCLSHQRQLFTMFGVYWVDFGMKLPPRGASWPQLVTLRQADLKIAVCPRDDVRSTWTPAATRPDGVVTGSYFANGFNDRLNDGTLLDRFGSPRVNGVSVNLERVPLPSSTLFLCEKVDFRANYDGIVMDYSANDHLVGVHYRRHDTGSNFSFLDGHGSMMKAGTLVSPPNRWTGEPAD